MAVVRMSIGLRISVCVVLLGPTVCLSATPAGYSAYTAWKDWARLRVGVQAGLASSYDRTGGNHDASYYEEPSGVRTESETVTAKTIQGPGIIYRFWMPHYTAKRNFIIRMYFDGQESPLIDTNSVTLLDGAFNYFASPLVDTFAGGQVCYEPIRFKSSVKIETENKPLENYPSWDGDRHYYQYSYLTFPSYTDLDSYTGTLTSQQQTARAEVVSLFDNVGSHPDMAGGINDVNDINTPGTVIAPNSSLTLADVNGPGIVRKLTVDVNDANDAELDGLRLRVFYDANSTAAIDVSVGNFFGAGKERAPYKSLPLGTDSDEGFYCYWPMPFRKSILVQLYNSTDVGIDVNSAVVQVQGKTSIDKMCYLHVTSNTSVKQAGQIYHPMVSANGCGHYVGNLLYIEQESYDFAMLEGDEIITVDGENVLNGTGLEDAYNGGYYYNWVAAQADEPEVPRPRSAIRPLCGILYVHRESGFEYARADQYRWQIADCVPFSKSIEVKIENRYAVEDARWTSVAFWYKYPCLKGDFDRDCNVDAYDFAVFASHWLQDNCSGADDCGGADFNHSQQVDMKDLAVLVENWL